VHYIFNNSGTDNHADNRDYNPLQGRWFSIDPAHSGWNAYTYASNGPVSFGDPSGLDDGDGGGGGGGGMPGSPGGVWSPTSAGGPCFMCGLNNAALYGLQPMANSLSYMAAQSEAEFLASGTIPWYQVSYTGNSFTGTGGDLMIHTGVLPTWNPDDGICPSGTDCDPLGAFVDVDQWYDLGSLASNVAANNGPTATIGPPQQWHPAKQPSALSKYVAFLGCYWVSVSRTITEEEDGQGWTAYGFINAGAILAIRSGAVFTPVGYTFVATAGLMDLSAGVKANQECTAAIYH
jgi:RHS repeat-associated protein